MAMLIDLEHMDQWAIVVGIPAIFRDVKLSVGAVKYTGAYAVFILICIEVGMVDFINAPEIRVKTEHGIRLGLMGGHGAGGNGGQAGREKQSCRPLEPTRTCGD